MPWEITGNNGTSATQHFLGTTDAQAFSIRVNSKRALRIEPGTTANLIGGHERNEVAAGVTGATISGGGSDGSPNRIEAAFGVIAGGLGNRVSGERATIGGGAGNLATRTGATVPGGEGNSAEGAYAFAAGRRAKASHAGTFVWSDANDSDFVSTADNQFLIRATGGVGIGITAPTQALHVVGDVQIDGTLRARSTEIADRKFAGGSTDPSAWQVYSVNGIFVDVDTSAAGFITTPWYVASITGNSSHWSTTGGSSIYDPTATGFRVYVRYEGSLAITPADAQALGWRIVWIGVEEPNVS